MDKVARRDADVEIRRRLDALAEIDRPGVVCGFLPFRDEPDLTPLLAAFRRRGIRIAVPEVVDGPGRELRMLEVEDATQLEATRPSHLGTRVPVVGRAIGTTDVASVLVPGVAFDDRGRRLGRGGGYFDAFLARLSASVPRIGVAYECQIVDRVPIEKHDTPVDWLCTERRTQQLK